jgi:hypothetical protein
VDYFSALEACVEKDKAPDKLIGYHMKTGDLQDKAMRGDQEARQICSTVRFGQTHRATPRSIDQFRQIKITQSLGAMTLNRQMSTMRQ